MSTYFPSGKDLAGKRKWFVVDAAGQTVGHLASEVASILTGKRNPAWTPFMDMGDHVIVINARQAVLKGAKAEQKMYRHHTRYPGGLREVSAADMFAKRGSRDLAGRSGDAPQEQTRQSDGEEAEGLRRWRTPTQRPAPPGTHPHPPTFRSETSQTKPRLSKQS